MCSCRESLEFKSNFVSADCGFDGIAPGDVKLTTIEPSTMENVATDYSECREADLIWRELVA